MVLGIVLSGAAIVLGVAWAYWLATRAPLWRRWLLVQVAAACAVAGLVLPGTDPSWFVLDEFVGAGLLVLASRTPRWLVVGAFFFGVLDAFKPLGIAYIEQLPVAFGVVGDDVAAGLLAAGALVAVTRLSSWRS